MTQINTCVSLGVHMHLWLLCRNAGHLFEWQRYDTSRKHARAHQVPCDRTLLVLVYRVPFTQGAVLSCLTWKVLFSMHARSQEDRSTSC